MLNLPKKQKIMQKYSEINKMPNYFTNKTIKEIK